MDLNKVYVVDIETKGFLHEIKGEEDDLHVLGVAYKSGEDWSVKTTRKRKDVEKLLGNPNNIIVGHNFYLFDIPSLEKIFKGIKIEAFVIDTLFLAWYVEPNRIKEGKKYGLADYGEDFGVKKPEIESWTGLSYEEYENRVTQDCIINTKLYFNLLSKLRTLYEGDDAKIESLIRFLMTKAAQYKMHQDNPLKIDVERAEKNKEVLEGLIEEKVAILKDVMPKIPLKSKRSKPKKLYKKDGDLTSLGEKWFSLLKERSLPEDYEGEIEIINSWSEPNPASNTQVKDWLFSLGWKPEIFIESVLKSGEINKVPQIKDKDKNLCKSVLKLADKHPEIKQLEDLGVIQHRLGIVKGFLRDCDEQGNIVAGIAGLTNTLRIRHKYLVNMPKPSAPYGQYIRSLIKPQEGRILVGSDLSSLENMTRNNFILPYDPEYVKEMEGDYYDSHLDIGEVAGIITEGESIFYKWYKESKKSEEAINPEIFGKDIEGFNSIVNSYKTKEEREKVFDKLDKTRSQAKTVSYSALYGVGALKLSKELKIRKKEAEVLLDAYWKRNWSVKKFSSTCEIKSIGKQMWVKNPINNFWYSLRSEKDVFSTVNQSAGDYIFTLWIYFMVKMGVIVQAGFHDEFVTSCKLSNKERLIKVIIEAINKVNKVLNLELPIGIDYKIGNNYAEVH